MRLCGKYFEYQRLTQTRTHKHTHTQRSDLLKSAELQLRRRPEKEGEAGGGISSLPSGISSLYPPVPERMTTTATTTPAPATMSTEWHRQRLQRAAVAVGTEEDNKKENVPAGNRRNQLRNQKEIHSIRDRTEKSRGREMKTGERIFVHGYRGFVVPPHSTWETRIKGTDRGKEWE